MHTHKYKRVTLSERTKTKVFKCQVPGCSRYLPRHLAVGQVSSCWKCGKDLVLTMENTVLAKPTCLECRGKKVNDIVLPGEVVNEVMEEKNKQVEDDVEKFLKSLGI